MPIFKKVESVGVDRLYVAQPITIRVLPHHFDRRRGNIDSFHMVAAALDLSVFASLQIAVFADILVEAWVGPEFLDAVPIVRLILLAIPPYLFYKTLRSMIDAATIQPRNAANVLAAFSIYLALIGSAIRFLPRGLLLEGIAGAVVVSCTILGMLTARTFHKVLGIKIPWRRCAPSLLATLALGVASAAFRWLFAGQVSLFAAALFELAVCGLLVVVLVRLGSPWLGYVWKLAFPRRSPA